MANWCSSAYVFRGEPEDISKFYRRLKSTCRPELAVKYGDPPVRKTRWLGNELAKHHISYKNIYCRGEITDIRLLDECTLGVWTETAWNPMPEVWDAILEKNYKTITYVYTAEEPGSEIYINTDTDGDFFPDRYVLEYWGHGDAILSEHYSDLEDLLADLAPIAERYGQPAPTSFEEAEQMVAAIQPLVEDEDGGIYLNMYTNPEEY